MTNSYSQFIECVVPVALINPVPGDRMPTPQEIAGARQRLLRGDPQLFCATDGGRLRVLRGRADLEAARSLGLREMSVFVRK